MFSRSCSHESLSYRCLWHISETIPFLVFYSATYNGRSGSHYQLVSSKVIESCLYGCCISTRQVLTSNSRSRRVVSQRRCFHLRHFPTVNSYPVLFPSPSIFSFLYIFMWHRNVS